MNNVLVLLLATLTNYVQAGNEISIPLPQSGYAYESCYCLLEICYAHGCWPVKCLCFSVYWPDYNYRIVLGQQQV